MVAKFGTNCTSICHHGNMIKAWAHITSEQTQKIKLSQKICQKIWQI